MRDNGIRRAAVFTTSAWGGYSGCAQYLEDIARARQAAGDAAPELVKLRQYFDHPLFVRDVRRGDRRPRDAARRPRRRPAGVHRALDSACARSRCGPDLYSASGRLRRAARRRRRGIRRLRPGVAVAVRAAAGAVAGTRRRRPPRGSGRQRHQGRDRLSDRVRRRPHRGGVGPRPRTAAAGRGSWASRSRGRPRRTPTVVRALAVDLVDELRTTASPSGFRARMRPPLQGFSVNGALCTPDCE